MTPKEQGLELINKFLKVNEEHFYQIHEVNDLLAAKQCALIAVNLVIEIAVGSYDKDHDNWWQEVKQEIEKL